MNDFGTKDRKSLLAVTALLAMSAMSGPFYGEVTGRIGHEREPWATGRGTAASSHEGREEARTQGSHACTHHREGVHLMPHEPKVGELPALPNELDFDQWYVEHAFDFERNPIGSRDCGLQRAAWHAGIVAEREARKDEARAVELLRRLVWTHVQGINTHDAAIESMDAWREAKAYVAALQAEQPEDDRG